MVEGAIPSIFPGPKYLSKIPKIIRKPHPDKYSIIDVKESNSNTTPMISDMPEINARNSQDSSVNDGKL